MSVLSRQDLRRLMSKRPPIVEGLLDPSLQIGPNGIDLTVKVVHRFDAVGHIGLSDSDRKLPVTAELKFDSDFLHLDSGPYKIVYNEIIHVPLNTIAIAMPRSSLLRSGVTVETAVWDSGYEGRSESLLLVHNPKGFEIARNARVIQLLFLKTSRRITKGYTGIYQKENL